MPHIRMRGLKLEDVKSISKKLLEELIETTELPRKAFTIEYIESTFILEDNEYPFIEVNWFDKGSENMRKISVTITDLLKVVGYENVSVYFNNLVKEQYFKNGKHF